MYKVRWLQRLVKNKTKSFLVVEKPFPSLHSEFRMLQSKKFFKAFWLFYKYSGLQPYKLSRFELLRGLILFAIFPFLSFAFSVVKILTSESVDVVISGVQLIPLFVTMFIDMIMLALNSREIEEFYKNFCRIIEELEEEKLFNKSYNKIMGVSRKLGVFSLISINGSSFAFLLTGRSSWLTWVPIGPGFYAVWVQQSVYNFYHVLQMWLVETFVFVMLSILNAYTVALRKRIQKMSMTHGDLVKCVEEYLQFKS